MKKLLGFLVLGLLFCNNVGAVTIADELTKLNNLYKEGAITKEEFSKAKDLLFKSESVKDKTETKKSEAKKKEKVKAETKKSKDKKEAKIRTFEEDLTETYITLEEANALGAFKKIEKAPDGMFEETHKTFKGRAKKSMMDMYDVFVRKKGLMEKYPENMMRAMGYFEFFYMDQLDKKKTSIKRFKEKYPNTGWFLAKEMKGLYSLNQARKSMREAMGLTLEEDPEVALEHYMTMYNFLGQGEKKINKLTGSEKKLKKESANFKKHYGVFKKTVQLKSEKRIDQKTFDKDLKKNIKNVKNTLGKLSKIDSKSDELYLTVSNMFEKSLEILEKCGANCERKNLLTVIDSVDLTNAVLADAEKDLIKKRFTQDMTKVDVETLSDQKKQILASVSSNMKNTKSIKREKLQGSVLNLENNDYPVDEFLDKIEKQGFEIKAVSMSFENVEEMKIWAMKDWANSWRGDLPSELKDNAGNLIEFTEENMEDLKAQLAINTYSGILDEAALDIKESMNENIQEIAEVVAASGGFDLDAWENYNFTIALDNYSQLVGNSYGIEMNDFKDLTKFANELYGSDMSPEDYASHWETAKFYESSSTWGEVTVGVDIINQVGSFDAGSIAAQLGTDLQLVADSIAQAASVGISTDLEAAAAGLGYDSFADAVAAYNAQYGTNYTAEEAAEALGN
jgi:hypothetical protein